MKKIFELTKISAGYNKKEIVKNISIDIYENDFVSILGQNGAGKSTLFKTMTGILKPYSGNIFLNNKDIFSTNERERAKLFSTVYQQYNNIPSYKVYDFLKLFRFPYQNYFQLNSKEDNHAIEDAIEITNISHLADKCITEISGGEQQLVLIAGALTQNNKIILLDEPISHLDIKHSLKIMDTLKILNQRGATIISILHNVNHAVNFCNKIIGLKNGKLICNTETELFIKNNYAEKIYDIKFDTLKSDLTDGTYFIPIKNN